MQQLQASAHALHRRQGGLIARQPRGHAGVDERLDEKKDEGGHGPSEARHHLHAGLVGDFHFGAECAQQ